MNLKPTTLYTRMTIGSLRVWSISVEDSIIVIEYGVMGGSMQRKEEAVNEGLQGRTIDEQILSRVGSRISKQVDKGYKYNIDDIGKRTLNRLRMKKPMLAKPLKNVPHIKFDQAFIQKKYDGHKCLITNHRGENIAYTRNGKIINSIRHILNQLDIPRGATLDGELYCHGMTLQKISSLIKLHQPDTTKLKYYLYDVVIDRPYRNRLNYISTLSNTNIIVAPTEVVNNHDDIQVHFEKAIEEGYEGSIVRWGALGYQDNKRSSSLVKVKKFFDTECKVIAIRKSTGGWARLCCVFKGETFWVSSPGCMEKKYTVMKEVDKYIGQFVQIEYASLTKGGVPFHPIATRWLFDISI